MLVSLSTHELQMIMDDDKIAYWAPPTCTSKDSALNTVSSPFFDDITSGNVNASA